MLAQKSRGIIIESIPIYKQYYPNPFADWLNDYNEISSEKEYKEIPSRNSSYDNLKQVNNRPVMLDFEEGKEKIVRGNNLQFKNQGSSKLPVLHNKRNVYKSMMRSMLKYLKSNSKNIMENLLEKGFTIKEIENAFDWIYGHFENNQNKGVQKKFQSTFKNIAKKKSIYTYILKDALEMKIESWKESFPSTMSKDNQFTYINLYLFHYEQICKLLSLEMKNFHINS